MRLFGKSGRARLMFSAAAGALTLGSGAAWAQDNAPINVDFLIYWRISGVYEPGDIEGFARALKHTGLAELKEDAGGAVRIVAAN